MHVREVCRQVALAAQSHPAQQLLLHAAQKCTDQGAHTSVIVPCISPVVYCTISYQEGPASVRVTACPSACLAATLISRLKVSVNDLRRNVVSSAVAETSSPGLPASDGGPTKEAEGAAPC